MGGKVIHLYDDEKIVDRTQKSYLNSCKDVEHVGIIFTSKNELRYVKEPSLFTIIQNKDVKSFTRNFDFKDVICVYVHFLTSQKLYFIDHVPSGINIGWGIYGGDLYNRYLRYFGYELIDGYKESLINRFLYPFKCMIRRPEFFRLMKRLSFIVACTPDYQLIKKYAGSNVPPQVDTFAYDMRGLLGQMYGADYTKGNTIIIGNSASQTNNHLYVLKYLKGHDIGNYSVLLPMAYGAPQQYVDRIESMYKDTFGDKVSCMRNFVPLELYNQQLKDGAVFIYGNWRQEALGNILVALYLGAKVYLSIKNPLLEYFKSLGVAIFALEEMDGTLTTPLTLEQKNNNRRYLENYHNADRKNELKIKYLYKYFSRDS